MDLSASIRFNACQNVPNTLTENQYQRLRSTLEITSQGDLELTFY